MTNAQIIFNESLELMKDGIIGTTGRQIKISYEKDGEQVEEIINEPEPIHTYKEWQNLGMQVQKGQKAIAKFTIWMFTDKPSKAALAAAAAAGKEEADADPHYYMKEAAFFSASQVAPAEEKKTA